MARPLPLVGPFRDMLDDLYGVRFPDALFYLYEFLETLSPDEYREMTTVVGFHPAGPFDVLRRIVSGTWEPPAEPILLHDRFYHDPPEFFTCMLGDTDGLHWGLLRDDEGTVFQGVASFYNRDGDPIQVSTSLFHALVRHADWSLRSSAEYLTYDPAQADAYRKRIDVATRFKDRLSAFVSEHHLPWDEGRPVGIPSDTGLSLILPASVLAGRHPRGRAVGAPPVRNPPAGKLAAMVAACAAGDVAPAFIHGRSLWFRGGDGASETAYTLLRAVYERLERSALLTVLELHHRHRDMEWVDLFRR